MSTHRLAIAATCAWLLLASDSLAQGIFVAQTQQDFSAPGAGPSFVPAPIVPLPESPPIAPVAGFTAPPILQVSPAPAFTYSSGYSTFAPVYGSTSSFLGDSMPAPYSYFAAEPMPARVYLGYGSSDFPFYGQPYGHPYDRFSWTTLSGGGGPPSRHYYPPVP